MPPAGFESKIPASEWPQTHALDRAATGIGQVLFTVFNCPSVQVLSLRSWNNYQFLEYNQLDAPVS